MFAFSVQDARQKRRQVLASLSDKVIEILDEPPGPCLHIGVKAWGRSYGQFLQFLFETSNSKSVVREKPLTLTDAPISGAASSTVP